MRYCRREGSLFRGGALYDKTAADLSKEFADRIDIYIFNGGLRMEKWELEYEKKLCSAAEAVRLVKDGERILVGGIAARPEGLVRALVDNAASFHGVKIMHGLSSGGEDYLKEEYKDNFIHETLFVSASTRKAVNEGCAVVYPCYYFEIGNLLKDRDIEVDVFMFQASLPNEHGYCSCGLNADFIREGVETADRVIMQVNAHMPRNAGIDSLVHVSEADRIVRCDEPMPAVPRTEITEIERKIGENCAALVEDGSTIQIGIGSIPDAVCQALMGKKNLGVHSEMISDGIMDLCRAGVITNTQKSNEKRTMVAAFVMGTQELYDFVDNNPAVTLMRASYTNDPFTIAKCSDLVCINTCIQVDLMGQVVSGSYGLRNISGSGGQLDFLRGAAITLDKKGKAIIAMTSVHEKNGVRTSRIRPFITEGSSVTVTRQDADYFVTEFGVAQVKGKNLKDRARCLIEIAHPDFRPELIAEYERRFKVAY